MLECLEGYVIIFQVWKREQKLLIALGLILFFAFCSGTHVIFYSYYTLGRLLDNFFTLLSIRKHLGLHPIQFFFLLYQSTRFSTPGSAMIGNFTGGETKRLLLLEGCLFSRPEVRGRSGSRSKRTKIRHTTLDPQFKRYPDEHAS